jgi:hypothetical protein
MAGPRRAERLMSMSVRSVSAAALLLGCTTTLDPTVLAGDGGADEPLATCSLFARSPSEYVICPEPLAFAAAASDCARRGSSLAAVGSAEENDFVATSAYGVVSGNLWLGGTRDDQYVWSWPDGSVFWRGGVDGSAEPDAFVLWQPEEPNDSSTVTSDPERCLALTLGGNDWNDRACSLSLPYVCERTGVPQ